MCSTNPSSCGITSLLILNSSYLNESIRLVRKMLPRRSPRLIQQAEKDGKRYVETTEIQAEERAATVIVTQETAATGVAERAVEVGEQKAR